MPQRELDETTEPVDAGEHPDETTLIGFSENRLPKAVREQVLGHLKSCTRCRQLLAAMGSDRTDTGSDTAPVYADRDAVIGWTVGEYEILDVLAQGGMGVVYRAVHTVIRKEAAIKVLLPHVADDLNHRHRLLAEAKAISAINHPNIVDVLGFGELPDGRHYFVMELLTGQPLTHVLGTHGRFKVSDVLTVLIQAMGALSAAHAAGVVHRDLKLSNLFATQLTDGLHITVLDFGIAKSTLLPVGAFATVPGAIIGTPGYMAPEQILAKGVGPPVDVYAMGVVAFRLLTATEPFGGVSDIDVLKAHLADPVPTLRSRGVEVGAPLEALIASMLAKEPAQRPTAAEVRRRAETMMRDLIGAPTVVADDDDRVSAESVAEVTRPPPLPRRSKRRGLPWMLLAGSAAAVALVAALLIYALS